MNYDTNLHTPYDDELTALTRDERIIVIESLMMYYEQLVTIMTESSKNNDGGSAYNLLENRTNMIETIITKLGND